MELLQALSHKAQRFADLDDEQLLAFSVDGAELPCLLTVSSYPPFCECDKCRDSFWPLRFEQMSSDYPFPYLLLEIHENQYERLLSKELQLPAGWTLGQKLYERHQNG